MSHVTFSALRSAAFCPRKWYYERTGEEENRKPPPLVRDRRELAHRYEELLGATDAALTAEPIAIPATSYREALSGTRSRLESAGRWKALVDPSERNVLVTGRKCRGIVHKVLTDPLEPSLVSTGVPPRQGVWEPQSVHAVAAAKALAWEHQTPVESAWLEYPTHGVVRRIAIGTRRKAKYRRTLRTVRTLDEPPARIDNRSKCEACEFASECGVRTRTLRSLLGFG